MNIITCGQHKKHAYISFCKRTSRYRSIVIGGAGIKGGGGWTAALINKILKETNFNFAYAAFGDVKNLQHIRCARIDYFIIPNKLNTAGCHPSKALDVCRMLVDSWQPDIIHVHGTEGLFGLLSARKMIKCPMVISLQGLLGPCSEWYRFFGNQSLWDIVRMHRWDELITMRGLWKEYRQIKKNAKREKEIICGNRFFMGRTSWDKSYVHMLNPKAKYYYEGRILRDAFWKKKWDINKVQRHRIISPMLNIHGKGRSAFWRPLRSYEMNIQSLKLLLLEVFRNEAAMACICVEDFKIVAV